MSTAHDSSTSPDCGSTPVQGVGQGTPDRKFRRVDACIALEGVVTKTPLFVAWALALHTDSTGVVTMALHELEAITGLTRHTLSPTLAALEEAGVLSIRRTGRAMVFRWLEPAYTTQRKCFRERPAAPP